VDFSLFRSLAPAHQPQNDLAKTIEELRKGLMAIHFDDGNFRNSFFMRLRVIADLRSRGLLNETLEWSDKHRRAHRRREQTAAACKVS
jgi:UDP-glucose 4-epimerase